MNLGSVPDISRLMFSVWRIKMKTDIVAAAAVISLELVTNHTTIGSTIPAAREPTDTRRDSSKKIINADRAIRQARGASMTKQPAVVATPLPPLLNFINSG